MTNTTAPRAIVLAIDEDLNTYRVPMGTADNRIRRVLARFVTLHIPVTDPARVVILPGDTSDADVEAALDALKHSFTPKADSPAVYVEATFSNGQAYEEGFGDDPYDEADEDEADEEAMHDCRRHANTAHAGHAHPCTKSARAKCRKANR